MAVHPLRSATHHRLGGPLPHQLANAPQVHPCSRLEGRFNIQSMRSEYLSGFSYRFQQLSQTHGQVTYVLLTRSPLSLFGSKLPKDFVRLACIRPVSYTHLTCTPYGRPFNAVLLTILLPYRGPTTPSLEMVWAPSLRCV